MVKQVEDSEIDRKIAKLKAAKAQEEQPKEIRESFKSPEVDTSKDGEVYKKVKKDVDTSKGFQKVELDEYSATIISDFSSKSDPFILTNKDPNFAYRFLRINDANLATKTSGLLHQKGGWQVCPKEHLIRIGIPPDRISEDGKYRSGDTILAFMPKSLYEKKEELKMLEAQAPMDAIQRMIKGGRRERDVEVHGTMKKGLQTAKQLGFGDRD